VTARGYDAAGPEVEFEPASPRLNFLSVHKPCVGALSLGAEARANALDGGGRGDRPEHGPLPNIAIAQIRIGG
jgi:hypothetical protein